MERIFLFDTTLRDGSQTKGIDFSVADKIAICEELASIGIDYIEAGWPGANPTDDKFFSSVPKFKNSKVVSFGMTRRAETSAGNDPSLNSVLSTEAPVTCLVGKTWDFHVKKTLNVSLNENLSMIDDSIKYSISKKKETIFDCEHFFDGYKNNKDYAIDCIRVAYDSGARWIVLCDTNGGSLPFEIEKIIAEIKNKFPEVPLGIHCHNDTGTAVASSLAAVKEGVRHVQGTINGIGERCGNADLITIIPNLILKLGFDVGIEKDKLVKLKKLSRMVDERLNRLSVANQPYVGESAFAHKGGLHASGMKKDNRTYEHISPELVGNERSFVISDQTGKSNIISRLLEIGIVFDQKDTRLNQLIDIIKNNEYMGYSYDTAEASFELLARKTLDNVPEYFLLGRFKVMDERRFNAKGQMVVESEATTTLQVGTDSFHEVAIGNGPVNAVDKALRKALTKIYPVLDDVELVDYKVRIIDSGSGTQATTRVLIECFSKEIGRWRSVGVSTNIIDASVMALSDALTWRLLKSGIQPISPVM